MNKAVFLDRDGTINIDKGYVYRIEDFQFTEGAPEAIKLLNDSHYKVIVVTNQSGIARGYYSEEDVINLHNEINRLLENYEAHIDCFYYCPHHPNYGNKKYRSSCLCRKPKTGLIDKAVKDFCVDIKKSWMIGDSESDLIAGASAGLRSMLICENPKGINEIKSLFDGVKCILKDNNN